MSLLVDVYRDNAVGEMEFLDPKDPSEEMAGLDVFRETFYGGRAARSLGLRLLPLLAERDLCVNGDGLTMLKDEATVVLENIGIFMDQAGTDVDFLRSHIQNILAAVERAQQEGGGVVIW
jgi:hypothetical protein